MALDQLKHKKKKKTYIYVCISHSRTRNNKNKVDERNNVDRAILVTLTMMGRAVCPLYDDEPLL